jgi:putative DNA primase/helicase
MATFKPLTDEAIQRLRDVFKDYIDKPQWVGWRPKRLSGGKYTKPPYNPNDPKQLAEPNNPATWETFDVALAAHQRGEFTGIGLCILNTNIVAFDLDNCVVDGSVTEPYADDLIKRTDTYTELSPSGTGLHIFGIGSGSSINRKQKVPNGHGMSVETCRAAAKYFTLTGNAFGPEKKLNGSAKPDEVVTELEGEKKEEKPSRPKPGKPRIDLDDVIKNGRYDLFKSDRSRAVWFVVNALIRAGKTDDEIKVLMLDRSNKISEHVHDQKQGAEKYLDRQIAKAREVELQGDGGLQDSLALEFSTKYASDVRYVHAWGKWLHWDGVRWAFEDTLAAFHLARDICRKADVAAADHKMVAGVVGLARTDRRQAAVTEQWDNDRSLLGTPKGTVDLHTGKLFAARSTDYITKITAVTPSDELPRHSCPLWLTFINRVTNGDQGLQEYLQRVCGYCLTGSTREDALFFAYGKGQNGKSVFLNTVADILMDYHEAADMELFVVTYGERHPTDLASLRGARLVTAFETEEGKRWAEAKLKQMTGGDPIKARFMRQDFFTYIPQFKLLFAGNYKPAIRNVDKAISRRFHLIPFTVTIPDKEVDRKLRGKLKAEWPGILRWMIDGCLEWQRIGLKPPKIVTDATAEYLESQDTLQNFFDDACVIEKGEFDTFEHLWNGWVDWCEHTREYVGTKKAFGQKLGDRGYQSIEYGKDNVVTYLGIRCIRENAKLQMAEAKRKSEEMRREAPPDYEPE